MIFNKETRARLIATVTTDFDPSAATVEVSVGGTWYPATWSGPATLSAGKWKRTATTDTYFRGVAATGTGVELAVQRHSSKTRVTLGEQVIVAESSPIDVR